MSKLKQKAEEYSDLVENYKNLSINPNELINYHSISEQKFDTIVSKLEETIQKDILKNPEISNDFKKIIDSLKPVIK